MCLSFLKENDSQIQGGISILTLAGLKLNKESATDETVDVQKILQRTQGG
jgi:hypothetical protein